MNKILIIIAVLLLLGIGGGAAFLMKSEDSTSEIATDQQTSEQMQGAETPVFDPIATIEQDFRAVVTLDGEQIGVIERDGDVTRFAGNFEGEEGEFIFTGDTYYACSAGECYQYPAGSSGLEAFLPQDFEFSEETLKEYQETAEYQGREDCSEGTCDVWTVSNDEGTATIYVEVETQRISRVEGTYEGQDIVMEYEYTDITINIPTNTRELP
jgi:hypothetical protein